MTTTANQYLPIVAWKTTVKDVVMLTSTTYRVTVSPIDINEPGAQLPILVGFYLKDFLGYTYRVSNINVGGIITNIELTDDFALGWGPQEGRIGLVYESVDLGTSPYLSPGKHKVLDRTALDYTRAFELDILWRNRYQYWTITPNALTPINVNSQTQIQFVDSSSVGWTITQVNSSLITVSAASVLPTASATVLGGIKIGAGLVITSGVASTLFTSLTTTGTGAATLVSGVLNIPTPSAATFVSLTTTGTSGAATLVGGVLNIPNYAGGGSMTYPSAGIALSTGTSGPWGTSLSTSGGGLQIVSNVLGIAYPSAGLVASSGSAWSAVTIGTGLTYTGGILAASGAMTYPPAGLPLSTGTAWGSSFDPAGHSGMTLIVAGASGGEHWAWYAPTPLTDDIEFEFRDINPTVSQIYILDISASWAYNVTSLFLQTDPGCTITITSVSIAGTAIVWGGSIIAPGSASILSIYPISGYTAYIGNQVTIVTSGVSTGYPVSLRGKLTRQRL